MNHISIRDLQKISGEAITALDGPTPIKSGDKTVGFIVPVRKINRKRLVSNLHRAEKLSGDHNVEADNRALEAFGPVDRTDWSAKGTAARPKAPRQSK